MDKNQEIIVLIGGAALVGLAAYEIWNWLNPTPSLKVSATTTNLNYSTGY